MVNTEKKEYKRIGFQTASFIIRLWLFLLFTKLAELESGSNLECYFVDDWFV